MPFWLDISHTPGRKRWSAIYTGQCSRPCPFWFSGRPWLAGDGRCKAAGRYCCLGGVMAHNNVLRGGLFGIGNRCDKSYLKQEGSIHQIRPFPGRGCIHIRAATLGYPALCSGFFNIGLAKAVAVVNGPPSRAGRAFAGRSTSHTIQPVV